MQDNEGMVSGSQNIGQQEQQKSGQQWPQQQRQPSQQGGNEDESQYRRPGQSGEQNKNG